MSQIDDQKQFKLGQQLAISQLQSVSDRYSTQQDAHLPFEPFPPLPSRKLQQSAFSINPRLSQNISNKRPQALLMEYSRGSYHHQDSSPGSAREWKVQLQKIGDAEVFECKCCRNTQAGCPFCMDTKSIKGNSNVIKFFQYVIAFKMGVNPSYGQKRLNSSSNRSVNQFCSDFFGNNRISTQSQYNARESSTRADRVNRMSIRSKKCPKSEIAKQLNTLVTIHENYRCDQCGSSPIVGNRYHCTQCQDYDECQHCHTINGHMHLMERVDRCGRGKQLQSMAQLLAQPTGKQSLRPPPSIKKETDMSSTTTRSALH